MIMRTLRRPDRSLRLLAACFVLLATVLATHAASPVHSEPVEVAEPAASVANAGRVMFLPLIRGPLTPPQPPDPPLTSAILRAELVAQLWDVPRGAVAPFRLELRNDGDADPQSPVEVYLPFEPTHLRFNGGQYSESGAYVAGYDGNDVTVKFPAIAPRERRSIKLYFEVRDDAPPGAIATIGGAVLAEQGGSAFGAPRVVSNRSTIRVSNSYNPSGRPSVQVMPTCVELNNRIDFSASGFLPGERLSTWINLPGGGARPNDQTATADNFGRAFFHLRPVEKGLSPASGYALVVSSQDQRRQAIGAFNIQPFCDGLQSTPLPVQNQPPVVAQLPQQIPTGGVAGQVIAADTGLPLADVLVQVRAADGSLLAGVTTDAAGRYLIAVGLPDGTHTIEYIAHNSPDPAIAVYGDRSFEFTVADGEIAERPFAVLLRGASISGTVTGAGSDAGLANVIVQVIDSNGAIRAITETAADGSYTTLALASGSYSLAFQPLFSTRVRTTGYLAATLSDVSLFAPTSLTGQDIALSRDTATGQISGQVTGAASAGLADVVVLISDAASGEIANIVLTDAEGNYVSDPLTAGTDRYKVGFYPSLLAGQSSRLYLAEYYADAPDRAGATLVSVDGGVIASGIDAELTLGGRISGTVSAGDSGAGLADVPVLIYNAADELVSSALSDDAGNYLTSGLAAGDYKLEFFPGFSANITTTGYVEQYYVNVQNIAEATPVAVTGGETTSDIDVSLSPGGRISGRVTVAGSGTGIAGIPVLFIVEDEVLGIAITEADGSYRSPGLAAGDYTLLFLPAIFDEPYADLELSTTVNVVVERTTADVDVTLAPRNQE